MVQRDVEEYEKGIVKVLTGPDCNRGRKWMTTRLVMRCSINCD